MAVKSKSSPTNQTKVDTGGADVRIETPKSNHQQPPKVSVIVGPEINPVTGFVDFLREYAVVGLAIGFVIGLQAQTLVKQLVSSFIDPLSQLLFGESLNQRAFTLHWHGRVASFSWGAFGYALLNFLFVLAAVYIIIKLLNLEKLDKPKRQRKS